MAGSDTHDWNDLPWWSWASPVAAAGLVAAKLAHLVPTGHPLVLVAAVVLLGGAVFSAVHHAEILAVKIGEPFGSILLALAITAIEVGLIISVMASGSAGSDAIARDTVFSVVMIVLNGVVGLCLVAGAARHFEQEFRVQGASTVLSVIASLAVISLVLPNFTLSTPGPTYATSQLLFVGTVALCIYGLFVFVQTVRHKDDFLMQPAVDPGHGAAPTTRISILAATLLVVALVCVIMLAKMLSPYVERSVRGAGLPIAVVGVVIAAVVLLPEALTAVRAAMRNRLQTSLNASLGSAAASIGLTIPIVGFASVLMGRPLTLGLEPEATVQLLLTLFVSVLTFATGRTNVMQGAIHLALFGIFLFLAAVP